MLDLADLRAFIRIADLRSVSAAARALKAPKSSVSRSLTRLEAALGAVLVERSTRHLRLTDAGTVFHPHAQRILNDVDEAETAVGSFAGVPRGTIRINAPYAFALALLAPMLPGFLARYPDVQVTLDVDNRPIDVLAEQADLVIRIGPLPVSGLIARRLATMELWACASPAYLAARGTPRSVHDLAGHDFAGRVEGTAPWVFRTAGGETQAIDITPRLAISDPAPTQVALAGGAGIGRLPDFMARGAIARGELVRVLPGLQSGRVDVHALYPSHRSLSAKVRVFLDALIAHVAAD